MTARVAEERQRVYLPRWLWRWSSLRNPLTAVSAIAQVLDQRLDRGANIEPERLRACLTSIRNSATQTTNMVDQLLDYARLQLDRPLDLNR